MFRIHVPADTTANAVGADAVFKEFERILGEGDLPITVGRSGSRGAFWLEPLVEVECGQDRLAFGPVTPDDVESIVAALLARVDHPLSLGPVGALSWLAEQKRVTFARIGEGDPLDLELYQRLQGFAGLRRAITLPRQAIVDDVLASGLRGRGGAAFPTGVKWQTVLDAQAQQKYIVCNADEGDSGTFADRLLMEADPYQLIEGMIIAGIAVGADRGYIYLRSEYPRAYQVLTQALSRCRQAGFLGETVLQSEYAFDIEVRLGAGAYICGEETALLNSLEGRRGVVRAKPPLPAIEGLFGQPTVVNNVLTLAAISSVLALGGEAYAALGVGPSKGTVAIQLSGNVQRGGLVEIPFGTTLRSVIDKWGGGTRSGRPLRAVQVGGPLGAYLHVDQLDTPVTYEALADAGGMLGHGGLVLFDDTVDMAQQARFAMHFCAEESCGKCTPCRIGAVRGREILDRVSHQEAADEDLILLRDLCDTMEQASLCAMGGLTPLPVRSALEHFSEDFVRANEPAGVVAGTQS